MKEFYSKVEPTKLLFVINRQSDISESRTDLAPEKEYLQASTKLLQKGTTFRPHRHKELERTTTITQEAWVFLKGKVLAKFWDIDDVFYYETELTEGDCAIVFYAGHSFEVLEDNTVLYEFKTGPYYGVEKDKCFITEEN